jgi:NtrC-family two-component system sensor histidine kinase KinB
MAFEAAGLRAPVTLDDLAIPGLDHHAIGTAVKRGINAPRQTDLTATIPIAREGRLQRLLPCVVPVPGLDRQESGAILVLYDVTDLARLDEMRSELVAVASHELQTPLTTLRMTLLMLQESSDVLPARQRELLATSLIGVEQLTETVHEFLDLTRIEAGELRLNLDPVHLPRLLADVVRYAEPPAAAQDIRVDVTTESALPNIIGDSRRLRIVFDNIVSNALKYTPSGGHITISSRVSTSAGITREPVVAVSVTDTGPGVPAGFRARIFDKFFRLELQHADNRPHPGGAGIGLYMCRQIVDLHGGRIECTAGPHGKGARITVELPLETSSTSLLTESTVQEAWQ